MQERASWVITGPAALALALTALVVLTPARPGAAQELGEDEIAAFQEDVEAFLDDGVEPPKIAEGLAETAADEGAVRVIVELDVPREDSEQFSPELNQALHLLDIAEAQIWVDLSLAPTDHEVKHEFGTIPFSALEVDGGALATLDESPLVRSVQPDHLDAPMLDDSNAIIESDEIWSGGHTGAGQAVAVLDTGVESGHAFLSGAVVAEACFSGGSDCPNGQTTQTGSGSGAACSYSSKCDHGTHGAGIVAGRETVTGYGTLKGVAPAASIIAIQVFSEFTGSSCGSSPSPCPLSYSSDQIAALEHVLSLAGTYDIASVNMSLGGGKYSKQSHCDSANSAKKAAIDNLRAAGITTVISSGNNGWNSAIGAPGCISSALAVGSTTKSDGVSSFSNHGSLVDVMAPGSSIASSVTSGG